jgi:hypothetical protein
MGLPVASQLFSRFTHKSHTDADWHEILQY